jgi:hypothetical protein
MYGSYSMHSPALSALCGILSVCTQMLLLVARRMVLAEAQEVSVVLKKI